MNVLSEKLKIVNVIDPVATAAATATSDIVNLENYNKCTFIVATGASSGNSDSTITILAGVSNASCAVAITFKYRTQIAQPTPDQGSDVSSALTDADAAGFAMTASKKGGVYIIEVDAAVVAAAGTDFDHVALHFVQATGSGAILGCVLAVLSEPRYAQDVLATAID